MRPPEWMCCCMYNKYDMRFCNLGNAIWIDIAYKLNLEGNWLHSKILGILEYYLVVIDTVENLAQRSSREREIDLP